MTERLKVTLTVTSELPLLEGFIDIPLNVTFDEFKSIIDSSALMCENSNCVWRVLDLYTNSIYIVHKINGIDISNKSNDEINSIVSKLFDKRLVILPGRKVI